MKKMTLPKMMLPLCLLVIISSTAMAIKVKIGGSSTDLNGCTTSISGYYDTETGEVHGEATFSGSIPCKIGTSTFFVTPSSSTDNPRDRLTVRFDTNNLKKVQSATWSGKDREAVRRLSDKALTEKFLASLRKAAFQQRSDNPKELKNVEAKKADIVVPKTDASTPKKDTTPKKDR